MSVSTGWNNFCEARQRTELFPAGQDNQGKVTAFIQ
jgi:hypothetical protein